MRRSAGVTVRHGVKPSTQGVLHQGMVGEVPMGPLVMGRGGRRCGVNPERAATCPLANGGVTRRQEFWSSSGCQRLAAPARVALQCSRRMRFCSAAPWGDAGKARCSGMGPMISGAHVTWPQDGQVLCRRTTAPECPQRGHGSARSMALATCVPIIQPTPSAQATKGAGESARSTSGTPTTMPMPTRDQRRCSRHGNNVASRDRALGPHAPGPMVAGVCWAALCLAMARRAPGAA